MVTLTEEEHVARAMLLGRVYDPTDRTYSIPSDGLQPVPTFNGAMDADTLEPLDWETARNRYNAITSPHNN